MDPASFFASGSLGEARWRVFCVQMERRFGSKRGGGRLREGVAEDDGGEEGSKATGNFFFPLCSMPVLGG